MKRAQFGPHDWLSLPVPPGPSWLLVDALEPETAYQFSVLAQNKLGTSAFSEVVTVNTLGEGRRLRSREGFPGGPGGPLPTACSVPLCGACPSPDALSPVAALGAGFLSGRGLAFVLPRQAGALQRPVASQGRVGGAPPSALPDSFLWPWPHLLAGVWPVLAVDSWSSVGLGAPSMPRERGRPSCPPRGLCCLQGLRL